MKSILTLCFVIICAVIFALPAIPVDEPKIQSEIYQEAGSLRMLIDNLGCGKDLTMPGTSTYYLYNGASWISGKRYRRDALGHQLYWLSPNPWAGNDTLVVQTDPRWHPGLNAAVDTLTTVGFDGDMHLYEFLPAYNPLTNSNPNVNQQYNPQDIVLRSILGSPAPQPFVIPDPSGTYCFSIPSSAPFDTPGFETLSAYYYDYCPFGTEGDRDRGASANTSRHYPLGLAVRRESFAWPLENHDQMIIFRSTLFNSSEVDTLFDIAVSEYVDCDVRPVYYGVEGASDDVSGYVKGTGYEFAYSRDFDGDDGQTGTMMGHKLIIPGFSGNRDVWSWHVGQGPDDKDNRDLQPIGQTANEKYWLCTGRNPNQSAYIPIRPSSPEIMQYETPSPADTRFLNTLYGNQPTSSNPHPSGRINIPPRSQLVYYSVYFTGSSVDDLKNRSQFIDSFVAGGLQLGNIESLTCIPYLLEPQAVYPAQINLTWQSYTNPANFLVMHKEFDSPASTWLSVSLPGTARSHQFIDMDPNRWYEIKVASIYNPGPNEVYLESSTKLINITNALDTEDPVLQPEIALCSYPNPFSTETRLKWNQKEPGDTKLQIYNLRGQLVRTILHPNLKSGEQLSSWDGRNDSGDRCGSGVYISKLSNGRYTGCCKLLLMR